MSVVTVVIVEDELIAAEFLKEMLESHGVEIVGMASGGKEAIQMCVELKPDVVFMDVMLDDSVSGSEAAVIISQKIETKIIFLSAFVDSEMVDYAVDSKAVAYLTKPYNEAQIIATMRLVANKQSATEPLKSKEDKIHLKGGYTYSTQQKRLLKDGKEIEMGSKALKLIGLLASQPNISISHEQISIHVWEEVVNDKTLRSLLFRVRKATDDAFIKNVSGTGYMVQTEQ